MSKINVDDYTLAAIDFAARIHCAATQADKDAIALYGGSLRLGFHIGSATLAKFTAAMKRVETVEYRAYIAGWPEDEIEALENEIAKLVARLNAPKPGRL
jgi:hypothetical protein